MEKGKSDIKKGILQRVQVLYILFFTIGLLITGKIIYLQYGISEGFSKGTMWNDILRPEYWTDFFWAHFLVVSLIVYAILLVVVSVGVYIPARKISRIPPTEALRDE